ncbi:MAG: VWA domain-containing protein, partial [Bryobacteraceae bacterium]
MLRNTLVFLLFLAVSARTQQIGQNAPANGGTPATFSTSSQLVVETVNVKDKNGKPVEGLTAKDFTVTEDGAEQSIRLFEYQKVSEVAEPEPPIPAVAQPLKKLPEAQITAEKPGDLRYQDRRLLVLYFDMTAMPPPDQLRAISAAQRFIRTQMTPADRMALMRFEGGAVRVMSDFTQNRERLNSILETMIVGEAQGFDETTSDDSTPDTGAAFGQDDSEFNIFNTNRQLSALQTAAHMLGQLSEKKSMLYFASGLRLNGLDNQAQLHATINAAVRAGVSFWPIDARGLVAQAPLGDATQGSPGGKGMYTGSSALAMTTNFQQSQDTLFALASDTGGKALLDNNDLARGIVQAQNSVSSYYIIGYYATNSALDGKFRRIKITLNNGLSASLDFRQGYFAGKTFGKFTTSEKERQLEDALMLGDPVTELTIAMEIDYFQLNRAEYFVPVAIKIPGRELALARKGGAEHTLIDFIGEVKDDYGSTIQNVRDRVDVKLSGETAARLAKQPIEYATSFTLLPGKYKIKLLARDAETGRIGTYETTFVIPNLNKEVQRIPVSSVVLSSQRVDLKEAIYNAVKSKEQAETTNPLVQEGEKLIPSVTRVFSKSRQMYIYLQAYEPAATTTQPLVAFVAFYRGQAKVFET